MNNTTKNYISVITLCFFLGISIYIFSNSYLRLHKSGAFRLRHPGPPNGQGRTPPTISIENIQSWMTFDYLNKVFMLPPEYLQKELAITDNFYPRITIRKAAAEAMTNQTLYLKHLQDLIENYDSNSH
jgi:hypothetical protein